MNQRELKKILGMVISKPWGESDFTHISIESTDPGFEHEDGSVDEGGLKVAFKLSARAIGEHCGHKEQEALATLMGGDDED